MKDGQILQTFYGGWLKVLFYKTKYNSSTCVIFDINKDLIDIFKAVRDNPKKLMMFLKEFEGKNNEKHNWRKHLKSLAKTSSDNYLYKYL